MNFMQTPVKYAPGRFCWADLSTSDASGAKEFYSSLFGWSYVDRPAGGAIYSMAVKNDRQVCALYQLDEKMAQGIPPHWNSYVSIESADAAAEKANALGGRVVAAPFDVMTVGRMAVIEDPTGAIFSVWQPRDHAGAGLTGAPGAMCWNELMTNDPARAKEFYGGLLGWTGEDIAFGESTYTMFKMGDATVAGMIEIGPAMGPVPPNWMLYFETDDVDADTARATAAGARVMAGPQDVPGMGRFVVMTDPQGAAVALWTSVKE
jgi:predicted enzyme related to lactoylglutathione lyase